MTTTRDSERLSFTLLISMIIHLIIVLGISFEDSPELNNPPVNNLEILLIKQHIENKPKKSDYLAWKNNESDGETEAPSPEPTPELPVPTVEQIPSSEPLMLAEAEPIPRSSEPESMPQETEPEPAQAKPIESKPENPVQKLTQKKAERQVEKVEKPETRPEPEAKVTAKPIPRPSAKDLMLQARNEIHDLQNNLDETTRLLNNLPKKRRISASTKEFAAAAYMKAWEIKVENIGNMNYPQEAKQKGLNGSLLLSVDINPDGSIPADGIVILRSSGHKVLDEAAIRIVLLGAPYAEIPENVLKNNDILTITRTWKFETGQGLSTR